MTVRGDTNPSRGLVELYYMAFLVGFFISGSLFFILNKLFPYYGMGEYDDVDVYGTLSAAEATKRGIVQLASSEIIAGVQADEEGKLPSEAVLEKEAWTQ